MQSSMSVMGDDAAAQSQGWIVGYWALTLYVSLTSIGAGIGDILQVQQLVAVFQHLGYPPHFMPLLGTWKVLGGLALLACAPGLAQVRIDVPVMIGGSADQDACPSSGVIVGLDPRGDGFLSVRSGPAGSYAEIDRLHNGNQVLICGDAGSWMAVVYGGDAGKCGVSRASPRRSS